MSFAERVYQALLGLYPKDFRQRYGLEMIQTFRDSHRQARLEHKTFTFWFATITDVFLSAIREHAQESSSMSPIVRIGAVCFVVGGLFDMYRSSQLIWGNLNAFDAGSVAGMLAFIIGVFGIAGLQAARTSPLNQLEKLGFAVVWIGFVLGFLRDASMTLLRNLGFGFLDSSWGWSSLNTAAPIWMRALVETYWLLNPIQLAIFLATFLGFIAVAIGRVRPSQGRINWRSVPPESWLLFAMSAWVLLRPLLQYPLIMTDTSLPRLAMIPVALMNLPENFIALSLGVALWLKSSSSSIPPLAKTT